MEIRNLVKVGDIRKFTLRNDTKSYIGIVLTVGASRIDVYPICDETRLTPYSLAVYSIESVSSVRLPKHIRAMAEECAKLCKKHIHIIDQIADLESENRAVCSRLDSLAKTLNSQTVVK